MNSVMRTQLRYFIPFIIGFVFYSSAISAEQTLKQESHTQNAIYIIDTLKDVTPKPKAAIILMPPQKTLTETLNI